jgi:hypothetical protein
MCLQLFANDCIIDKILTQHTSVLSMRSNSESYDAFYRIKIKLFEILFHVVSIKLIITRVNILSNFKRNPTFVTIFTHHW